MSRSRLARYKSAAIQYEPRIHEKARNVKYQLGKTIEAAKNGAKLIVLPEMNQVGYCYYSREEIRPYVESVPGPTSKKYAEVARKYETNIVVGLAEVDLDTNNYYNTQALIGPDGLIGKYRKVHSYISEPKWAKDGDLGFPVFSTEVGKLGLLICMDYHYFESSRILSLRGAEVICFSTNWLAERGPAPVWITRSFENGVYTVCADRWGVERGVQFTGGSCILNPDGSIQNLKDAGNGVVYGEIDLEMARKKKFPVGGDDRFDGRRPDEYMGVTLNTYLWNPLDFFGLYEHRPQPAGKKSIVAVAQIRPLGPNVEKNLDKIAGYADAADSSSAELLVLPELAATGAVFRTRGEAREVAEGVRGETLRSLASIARKNRMMLVTSIVEVEGDRLYNSAVLVGRDGLIGKYRKLHLNYLDRRWATPGDLGLPTFDTPVGRLGLLIGHDSMFPETYRCLAADAADIICAPSAVEYPRPIASRGTRIRHPEPIPRGADPLHWHLWRVRAGENCTFVAFANQVGRESEAKFMGYSGIFQPDLFAFPRNESVATGHDEEIRSLTVDTTNADETNVSTSPARIKYLLRMRRPYWYDPIVMGPDRFRAVTVRSRDG